jgi:hypothetical protein
MKTKNTGYQRFLPSDFQFIGRYSCHSSALFVLQILRALLNELHFGRVANRSYSHTSGLSLLMLLSDSLLHNAAQNSLDASGSMLNVAFQVTFDTFIDSFSRFNEKGTNHIRNYSTL